MTTTGDSSSGGTTSEETTTTNGPTPTTDGPTTTDPPTTDGPTTTDAPTTDNTDTTDSSATDTGTTTTTTDTGTTTTTTDTGTTTTTDTGTTTTTDTGTTTTTGDTDTEGTTGTTGDTETDTDTGGAVCDNGMLEDGEVCDTDDLAGQDCVMQGFDAGTLACADDCASFDISGCVMFSCGNAKIEGNEICDGAELGGQDCAAQGFDGGTLACADNCGAFDVAGCFKCGDNVLGGPEVCDGADLGGATCMTQGFVSGTLVCSADCSAFDTTGCTTCGDNKAQDNEQCDAKDLKGATCTSQGAGIGPLSCTNTCTFDVSTCFAGVPESEPNDDTMVAVGTNDFSKDNANGPFTTNTLIGAAISPVGDDDIYAVTNASNGYALLRLETFGAGGPGTCALPTDTVIEIRTATNTLITSDDQAGINSCSLIQNFPMGPGETVYVRVIDWQDNDPIPTYYLDIKFTPIVCGDAAVGIGEQCDDGNVVNNDGCSSTCKLESATQEIEPNNTNAQADATMLVSTGNSLYGGAIVPIGDLDRYRIDLAATEYVRLETFSELNDCKSITTTMRVFNAANMLQIADTEAAGISGCSALVFPLPAGSSYVQVEETGNNATVPAYLFEVKALTFAGMETEPNDTLATASTVIQMAGSDVQVLGDHSVGADSDYYAIDVPVAGSSLRLEVIEGDRAVETCESNGVDSRVTLYNSNGMQLADNDDTGRGFCSLIDGTGTTPSNTGAKNLAAGTYYVQVRASSLANANGGAFIYRLAATIRKP